ncbi:unnamed protein product, partial [Ilex paraguariensis]
DVGSEIGWRKGDEGRWFVTLVELVTWLEAIGWACWLAGGGIVALRKMKGRESGGTIYKFNVIWI